MKFWDGLQINMLISQFARFPFIKSEILLFPVTTICNKLLWCWHCSRAFTFLHHIQYPFLYESLHYLFSIISHTKFIGWSSAHYEIRYVCYNVIYIKTVDSFKLVSGKLLILCQMIDLYPRIGIVFDISILNVSAEEAFVRFSELNWKKKYSRFVFR